MEDGGGSSRYFLNYVVPVPKAGKLMEADKQPTKAPKTKPNTLFARCNTSICRSMVPDFDRSLPGISKSSIGVRWYYRIAK